MPFTWNDARFAILCLRGDLGPVETVAGPPRTTSHVEVTPEQRAAMGIPESLIRYSVGVEDVNDLIADLTQALEKTKPTTGNPPPEQWLRDECRLRFLTQYRPEPEGPLFPARNGILPSPQDRGAYRREESTGSCGIFCTT